VQQQRAASNLLPQIASFRKLYNHKFASATFLCKDTPVPQKLCKAFPTIWRHHNFATQGPIWQQMHTCCMWFDLKEIAHLSVCLCVCLSVCLCACVSVCVSVCLCVSVSVSVCVCLCESVCVCVCLCLSDCAWLCRSGSCVLCVLCIA
jgi:hypothetical protein